MTNKTPEILPASRVSQIKEYYFSRKLREIARLNREGKDIISLGVGGPDLPPAPEVIESLCSNALQPDTHSYQSYAGIPELREAYARWYEKHFHVHLDPATEILPLIGSKEGIMHISLAFLNPGDGVLVPDPGYPTYTSVSRLIGAEIHTYALTEDGGWLPDFDELEKSDLSNVKLMWLNYPHMPTGTPATEDLFRRAVDFAKRHGIVIVNDNPYSFILHDERLSILAIPGAKDVAIEMNSLSKSHNMAGWRMGMAASNAQFISWILKVKSNIDSGQFRPMLLAAARALEADDEWYENVNRTYKARRDIAAEIMHALGCAFDPRQRGLFLWGRIPEQVVSAEEMADDVLARARVFVTPGSIFGKNGNRYIRISLCAPEPRLREALARIKSMH